LILALLLIYIGTDNSAHITPVEETTAGLFLNRMENAVIQHTFLKFDQSKKKQIFNKNPRTSNKIEKPQI